jgi:dynein intermediate chain 1
MTNTEPPPRRVFSEVVNQFSIFDAYNEDMLQKEKLAKEKSKSKGQKEEDTKGLLPSEAHGEEVYYKNHEFGKAIIIIERMANQNTFDDIAQDYKYWEDAADELGDRKGIIYLPVTFLRRYLAPTVEIRLRKEQEKASDGCLLEPKKPRSIRRILWNLRVL